MAAALSFSMLDRRAEKLVRECLKLGPAIAPPGGLLELPACAFLLIGRRAWNP